MFRDFCGLYNAALQRRIEAWPTACIGHPQRQADELKAVSSVNCRL